MTMNLRTSSFFIGTIIVAMFATGVLVYPHLPLFSASHWDSAGHANGMLPRFWAAFLAPSIALALWGLWALLPKIDPIAPGFKGFRYVYDFIWILLTALLAYVYALTLLAGIGTPVDMARFIVPVLALFFAVLGALLPLVRRNWFVGIRTPWTISSDLVWSKTHLLGSRLLILAGFVMLLAAFGSRAALPWLVLTPLLLSALIPVVYSYILFRRTRRGEV